MATQHEAGKYEDDTRKKFQNGSAALTKLMCFQSKKHSAHWHLGILRGVKKTQFLIYKTIDDANFQKHMKVRME